MVNKILFIEGSRDRTNGILAQGFHKLIFQECKGNMPRIVMSDDKNNAIAKFLNNRLSEYAFILIDLDKPACDKNNDLIENCLISFSSFVFYMIQEMEAWFLSQPDVLNGFYGIDFRKKLKLKHPMDIPNPDEFLQKLTKNTKRGEYHKISHGTELLSRLKSSQLRIDFDDYNNLIEAIIR